MSPHVNLEWSQLVIQDTLFRTAHACSADRLNATAELSMWGLLLVLLMNNTLNDKRRPIYPCHLQWSTGPSLVSAISVCIKLYFNHPFQVQDSRPTRVHEPQKSLMPENILILREPGKACLFWHQRYGRCISVTSLGGRTAMILLEIIYTYRSWDTCLRVQVTYCFHQNWITFMLTHFGPCSIISHNKNTDSC